jgi:WD40 repeat protein
MEKLSQDLVDKKFTDITLNLVDSNRSIIIEAHRVVLGYLSDYFMKIFSFGNEKNQSHIVIRVNDARIAHDIIFSLYGRKINSTDLPDWLRILETAKCRDFFCLDNDVTLLYDLTIPPEYFDLFMEVISNFVYIDDMKLMATIRKNIPIDYDLENLSVEFVEQLLTNNYCIVSGFSSGNIIIYNSLGQKLHTLNDTRGCAYLAISADHQKFVAGTTNKHIELYDAKTFRQLKSFNRSLFMSNMAYSSNGSVIAYSTGTCIKIWDDVGKELFNRVLENSDYNNCIAISHCDKKIISGGKNGCILLNYETGELIKLKCCCCWVTNVIFSLDDSKIIITDDGSNIETCDIATDTLLNTMPDHIGLVTCIALSSNGLSLVSGSTDTTIKIWDVENGNLLRTLYNNQGVKCVAFSPNNLEIISGSIDGDIDIWNITTCERLLTFTGSFYNMPICVICYPIMGEIDCKLEEFIRAKKIQTK